MAQTATKPPRVMEPSQAPPLAERSYSPECFLNREMSWLQSHAKLIDEAEDPTHTLERRMSFVAFFSEKLDEFFSVRVAGIREKETYSGGRKVRGGAVSMQPRAISHRAKQLVARQYHCWNGSIRPALSRAGINILREYELHERERSSLKDFFLQSLVPILTPLAIDKCHPRPAFQNHGLYLGALLSRRTDLGPDRLFGVVQLPAGLSRFVPVDGGRRRTFVFLEDVIAAHLCQLFGGYTLSDWSVFRFTRDSRVDVAERYPDCALCSAEHRVKARRRGNIVRLEVTAGAHPEIVDKLVQGGSDSSSFEFDTETRREVYSIPGPIDLCALKELTAILQDCKRPGRSASSRSARRANRTGKTDMFATIAKGDVLLHHPHQSFTPVIDFLNQAADDPHVLSVSQTLYRIGENNPLITPLVRAADNGKHVTALVELNARLDEADNIRWARQLERDGVHVVFGFKDFKTHCKLAMVVRQEESGIKRYVHLATGNYHDTTVPYTDLGLLTADDDIGADAASIFNMLTGYAESRGWRKVAVAPENLHAITIELINEQAERARTGAASRIFAKLNTLTDKTVIEALYGASQHGVPIQLVVTGVCTLRPGVSGVSENICVRSVFDKYYEHSRLFVFGRDEAAKVFLSSADWMPRNFHRRVEVMFPIEAADSRERILKQIVPAYLSRTAKTRVLRPDGTYIPAGNDADRSMIATRLE